MTRETFHPVSFQARHASHIAHLVLVVELMKQESLISIFLNMGHSSSWFRYAEKKKYTSILLLVYRVGNVVIPVAAIFLTICCQAWIKLSSLILPKINSGAHRDLRMLVCFVNHIRPMDPVRNSSFDSRFKTRLTKGGRGTLCFVLQ